MSNHGFTKVKDYIFDNTTFIEASSKMLYNDYNTDIKITKTLQLTIETTLQTWITITTVQTKLNTLKRVQKLVQKFKRNIKNNTQKKYLGE